MTRPRSAALMLPLALLAGCQSMAPKYVPTPLPVPQSWPTGDAYLRQSEATLPGYAWRDVFADPRLQQVITTALANSEDVKKAAALVAEARAQFKVQRAEQLPELDAGLGYRRAGGQGSTLPNSTFTAQGSVPAYEVDLFGRLRSLTSAAQDRWFSSESAARATRLTLVADVADAWIQYGEDASLLAVARQTAAAAQDSVRLTDRRLTGGIAPRSDLAQAQIVLQTAQADVASQTNALAQDANALRLLAGAEIAPALLPTSIEDAAAHLGEVPAGVDSTILLRRPDVIAAEWTLKAANADIGAARAALFPKITLTGLFGLASTALASLFTGGAFAWQAAANVDYPIFRAGAGRANVRLSEATRDAALADYRKAIQSAFRDVADALARRGTIGPQLDAVAAGRAAAADNLALAHKRYQGGIDSYLAELVARQSLYSAERTLATTRQLRAANLVALYRALGGDPSLASPPR